MEKSVAIFQDFTTGHPLGFDDVCAALGQELLTKQLQNWSAFRQCRGRHGHTAAHFRSRLICVTASLLTRSSYHSPYRVRHTLRSPCTCWRPIGTLCGKTRWNKTMLLVDQVELLRQHIVQLENQRFSLPLMGGPSATIQTYHFKTLVHPARDIATTIAQADPAGNKLPSNLRGWNLIAKDSWGHCQTNWPGAEEAIIEDSQGAS